jgi:hypothetical protein
MAICNVFVIFCGFVWKILYILTIRDNGTKKVDLIINNNLFDFFY